jgi:hypothetical protein
VDISHPRSLMWWLVALVVLIALSALMAVVAWRPHRGRAGDKVLTQRDLDKQNSKGIHGGFTGSGPR